MGAAAQREPVPITTQGAPGPAVEEEDQKNQWQRSGACGGCGISLNLDQVQRKQEEEYSNRGIQEQSEQIGAAEARRRKQRQWRHRRSYAGFDEHEPSQTAAADNQTPDYERM